MPIADSPRYLTPACLEVVEHANVDSPDYERRYSAHVATCPICGSRTYRNTRSKFQSSVRAAFWRMFAPLAVTEVAVTFALAMTLGPVGVGEILLGAAFVIAGTIGFFLVHVLAARRLMVRRLLPVLDYRFFRTGVDELEDHDRLEASTALVRGYLHFAKRSAVATALTYASGAAIFAAITSQIAVGVLAAGLGFVWAALFRVRLATIRFDSIISTAGDEGQRLARVQYRSSRTYRLLAVQGVLATATRLHDVILLVVAGTAALGLGISTSGLTRACGLLALSVAAICYLGFSVWIRRQILFSNPNTGTATDPAVGERCVLLSQE